MDWESDGRKRGKGGEENEGKGKGGEGEWREREGGGREGEKEGREGVIIIKAVGSGPTCMYMFVYWQEIFIRVHSASNK